MPSATERSELIRLTMEVFVGSILPIQEWIPSLKSKEPNRNERSRAFPILFGCIKDMALAGHDPFKGLIQKAKLLDDLYLVSNMEELLLQLTYAVELVHEFSQEDQIVLEILRHRLVHGFLAGVNRESYTFRVIHKSGVRKIRLTYNEHSELLRSRIHQTKDQYIEALISQNKSALEAYINSEICQIPHEKLQFIHEQIEKGCIIYFETRSRFQRHGLANPSKT